MAKLICNVVGGQPDCQSYVIEDGELAQQRGFPLRKYFIPGCVGRGLDLDLRVRPAAPAPAAASGNLGICPLGIEVEKQGFRTAWLITGQKFP